MGTAFHFSTSHKFSPIPRGHRWQNPGAAPGSNSIDFSGVLSPDTTTVIKAAAENFPAASGFYSCRSDQFDRRVYTRNPDPARGISTTAVHSKYSDAGYRMRLLFHNIFASRELG